MAIQKINYSPNPRDAWTIYIDGDVAGTTNIENLNASTLTICKKIENTVNATLNGTIGLTNQGPVLSVTEAAEIIIENVDIHDGSGSNGAGISIDNPSAKITFKNGTITHCIASTHGGAVYISNGTFILDGDIIGGTTNPMNTNSANKGGGIFNNGTVNLVNTYSIKNNTASESGGGIYNTSNGIIKVNGTITTGTDIANVTLNYNNSGENNVDRE